MLGVGSLLTRDANTYPERVAIFSNGEEYTYAELNKRVNILANNLQKLGLKKGDRVAYLFRNSVLPVEIFFATQKIGAVAVPLNFRAMASEIDYCINFSEARVLIYEDAYSALIAEIRDNLSDVKIFISNEKQRPADVLDLENLCENGTAAEPEDTINIEEDVSIILFTSGSTGVPKGVIHTHRSFRELSMILATGTYDKLHETFVTHCPLFHTSGMQLLIRQIAVAGTFVLIDKLEPEYILELIERFKATHLLLLPPVLYIRLREVKDVEKYDLSSVLEAQASGGGWSWKYIETIFDLFPNCEGIRYGWGMTEVGIGIGWGFTKEEILADPSVMKSVGKTAPFVEIRLVDENGNDVADGEVGEGIVRSGAVMSGYLKQPETTAKTLKDGWLYSGDLFKKAENGFYYMVDRAKDMIKQGGENVFAQEVESVLLTHPEIVNAAVIGVEDDRWGEAVAAAVVTTPESNLRDADIVKFCKERMPGYKCPKYFLFMAELPVNSIGKIQKNDIRKMAAQFVKAPGA